MLRSCGRSPKSITAPSQREPCQSASGFRSRRVLSDPRVQQPSWTRSYLAPSFTAGATAHAYPLEVLAEIFGGTSTSRLYRSLVIEQKLATSAGAYYRGSSLDLATFRIYASPRPGVTLDQLEAAVDAEIERLRSQPISDQEAARATQRLVAEATYAQDSLSTAVRSFGVALATGRTVEDVEAWPERIGAVTAAEVNAAAAHVFRPEYSVTGRLVTAPDRTTATVPVPAVPAPGLTGDGEIGAEQDANG